MQPKVGIGILVLHEGKILLAQRKVIPGKGEWAGAGGHLEWGETLEDCVRRELLEETGLIAEKIIISPTWIELMDPHYIDFQSIVTEFSGTLENREPEKHGEWQWFDPSDLPSPLFDGLKPLLLENSLEPFLRKNLLSYLSAPYHHPDPEIQKERYQKITEFAGNLIKEGTYVYSPITHNIPIKNMGIITTWEGGWKPYDLTMLSLCNQLIVYQLPGWDTSRGVGEEIAFAKEKNIPIIEMKPEALV